MFRWAPCLGCQGCQAGLNGVHNRMKQLGVGAEAEDCLGKCNP